MRTLLACYVLEPNVTGGGPDFLLGALLLLLVAPTFLAMVLWIVPLALVAISFANVSLVARKRLRLSAVCVAIVWLLCVLAQPSGVHFFDRGAPANPGTHLRAPAS